ncbi:MAG TPA: S24 family peptidase [Bryobacteraceae bacterium]|nr:S24 family peptidase [Bryobacteraceae bacterium]
MPASVVPITGQRQGEYVLLEAALPGRPARNIGVLLIDSQTGRGWLRLRERFDGLADAEDAEVLEALEPDCRARMAEDGAAAWLEWLEDRCSNVIRVSARQTVAVDAFSRALERLYGEHVEKVEVVPFRTHVPLYSLRAAAGGLGEEMEADVEEWVPAPEGMRIEPDLFVAHVMGRSMEPRIPDGSLNLFRLKPVGSRQNKILLIQLYGVVDDTARYTVKRYTSTKVATGPDPEDPQWEHQRIRLEPLNPEFEAWDVGPRDFAVVAEWLRVIE